MIDSPSFFINCCCNASEAKLTLFLEHFSHGYLISFRSFFFVILERWLQTAILSFEKSVLWLWFWCPRQPVALFSDLCMSCINMKANRDNHFVMWCVNIWWSCCVVFSFSVSLLGNLLCAYVWSAIQWQLEWKTHWFK